MRGVKKVDDVILAKMLKEGKTQREAADYFHVSEAAISKRVKRLLPSKLPEPPESFKALTPREQRFVLEKTKGVSNTEAALRATESKNREVAKSVGHELAQSKRVQYALQELLEMHIPQKYRVEKLRACVDHLDPGITLKALDLSWKLDGSYTADKTDPDQLVLVFMKNIVRPEKDEEE